MLPSPQDLQGFVQIVISKNITKAATVIGVTQPSLSQSLKRLEESVGEQLLIRSKSGVQLTKAGEKIYQNAKQLIEQWEQLKIEARQSRQEIKGTVKLGCHSSVGQYTLGLFLPRLLKKNPQIDFHLSHSLSRRVLDQLINYELDLALVINPVFHPDLRLHRLGKDKVRIWKAKNSNSDVLIFDPELMQAQHILKKLKQKKSSYSRFITSESLEVITQLCLEGAGAGIIPERVVKLYDVKKRLSFENSSPDYSDELFLASRVENRPIQTIEVVRKAIISAFEGD